MLAAGSLAPSVEITSDDDSLREDPSIGILWLSAPGDAGAVMGGFLHDGMGRSNRAPYALRPVSGVVVLPIEIDSDPVAFPAIGLEMTLTMDGDGFWAELHFAVRESDFRRATFPSIVQLLLAEPKRHESQFYSLDVAADGTITDGDFWQDFIVANLTAPDVQLFDDHGNWSPCPLDHAPDSLSFGIRFHLKPCEAGRCATSTPPPSCSDRIRNGNETDVDCGGSCLQCTGGHSCMRGRDCQLGRCIAGRCAEPSCTDGFQDGFETDVDCGENCPPCATGKMCWEDEDCASHTCGAVFPGCTDPTCIGARFWPPATCD
jgi:hypothetical protein